MPVALRYAINHINITFYGRILVIVGASIRLSNYKWHKILELRDCWKRLNRDSVPSQHHCAEQYLNPAKRFRKLDWTHFTFWDAKLPPVSIFTIKKRNYNKVYSFKYFHCTCEGGPPSKTLHLVKYPVTVWVGGVICPEGAQVSLWPLRAKGISIACPPSFSLPVKVS